MKWTEPLNFTDKSWLTASRSVFNTCSPLTTIDYTRAATTAKWTPALSTTKLAAVYMRRYCRTPLVHTCAHVQSVHCRWMEKMYNAFFLPLLLMRTPYSTYMYNVQMYKSTGTGLDRKLWSLVNKERYKRWKIKSRVLLSTLPYLPRFFVKLQLHWPFSPCNWCNFKQLDILFMKFLGFLILNWMSYTTCDDGDMMMRVKTLEIFIQFRNVNLF